MMQAAADALEGDVSQEADMVRHEYVAAREVAASEIEPQGATKHDELRLRAIAAQRRTLDVYRTTGLIGDEAFHRLQEEVDWAELAAAPAGTFQALLTEAGPANDSCTRCASWWPPGSRLNGGTHGGAKEATNRKEPAELFTGDVWYDVIIGADYQRMRVNTVRFAPGARTGWHSHPGGQTLHLVDGRGLVQSRGGEVIEIRPGA
jgi:mannose-6-phosphate isomerase-like protein (cupin superfamily)